jgi:hypothetical protein
VFQADKTVPHDPPNPSAHHETQADIPQNGLQTLGRARLQYSTARCELLPGIACGQSQAGAKSELTYVIDGSAVAVMRMPLPRTTATKLSPASMGAGTVWGSGLSSIFTWVAP